MAKPKKDDASAAARALGRRGGLKGGAARAASLTPERRSQIARDAVRARWDRVREAQADYKAEGPEE